MVLFDIICLFEVWGVVRCQMTFTLLSDNVKRLNIPEWKFSPIIRCVRSILFADTVIQKYLGPNTIY